MSYDFGAAIGSDHLFRPIFCRTPDPWRPGQTVKPYLHNKGNVEEEVVFCN
ncbi:hypothetical protein C1646_767547 [Rhizophagus diaphanus]|nr:hypothetical protein C1646_767547 [Rhizophagus diaphanus] [Rhizophagus sp. MUCL 43196]